VACIQAPKLTFFGRRQLATEIFFRRQMEKCGRQKVLVKLSFVAKHEPKLLVAAGLQA